jgi:hypothetical protein
MINRLRRVAVFMASIAMALVATGLSAQQKPAPTRPLAKVPVAAQTSVYFPGPHPDWARRTPEASGLDPVALRAAVDFAIGGSSAA